jgi:hypothetical protein
MSREGEGYRRDRRESAESHVIGKPKPYRGSTRMNADQDVIGKPGKNAIQDADCTD